MQKVGEHYDIWNVFLSLNWAFGFFKIFKFYFIDLAVSS